ncbi:MAG: hypothetical protein ABJ059_09355, partial [Hyphomicrobiales bacterium]
FRRAAQFPDFPAQPNNIWPDGLTTDPHHSFSAVADATSMSHCVLLLLATLRMRANMNIFNIREFCVACLRVWFVWQVVCVPWSNTISNTWDE